MRKKTNEEFLKEVKELVGDEYTFLEEYERSNLKLKVRHNSCGYEYNVTPCNFLSGKRCPKCANNIKRTNEQFLKEVKELVGNEYTFLEEYSGTNNKIKVRHNRCGYEYNVTPNTFLNKKCKCPYCEILKNSKKRTKTNEQFLKEVKELVGDEYTFLEEYERSNLKLKVRHNSCGYEYNVTPCNFLSGKRCPKCANNIKRTNEQFLKEVKELVGNEYTFLEEYINTDIPIKVIHNKCNNEYYVAPKEFIHNKARCPHCLKINKNSIYSNIIEDFLIKNKINYKREEKCLNFSNSKYFDFLINENIYLEYDGKQHFEKSFNTDKDFRYQLKRYK